MKCGSVKYTSRFEQGAKLPMSIIIVRVGQAEFDGKNISAFPSDIP